MLPEPNASRRGGGPLRQAPGGHPLRQAPGGHQPWSARLTPRRQRPAPTISPTGNRVGRPGQEGRLAWPLVAPPSPSAALADLLDRYQPETAAEAADVRRLRALAAASADPWRRDLPLHVTASALVVHPPPARVLLRWHPRHRAWLQVGGHGDPGETDPLAIALREAWEETGLADLVPWPDAAIRHVAIVSVPGGNGEPAHEHADIRYFLATAAPDAARAENAAAPLRWLSLAEARQAAAEDNLTQTLARLERLRPR